ncbi:hypothetical protein PHYBOEH_005653 [Phytophthora boehmeriae]|uniref:RxLR effector protein n=1 Tax=Phytophthora boehmeriae TaxID=109152 RepID=A0A8T1WL57_9STRA|nr:hypothetical protein PHYBOEH_005653 [Phytophthora boehmeriae]
MRVSFMLFATMAVAFFATCDATVDSTHARISMMTSPDLVRSLENDDAVAKRSLREHKHHKHYEESEAEERGGGFPGSSGLKSLLGGSSKAAKEAAKQAAKEAAEEKAEVQRIASVIMERSDMFESAYHALKKYTLTDLRKHLDVDDNDKFLQFYNSIVFRRHMN